MELKPVAREWQAIECIQTCIKSNIGIGTHLPIKFSMQVDLNDQRLLLRQLNEIGVKTTLNYDFKQIGNEYEAIIKEEAAKLMI